MNIKQNGVKFIKVFLLFYVALFLVVMFFVFSTIVNATASTEDEENMQKYYDVVLPLVIDRMPESADLEVFYREVYEYYSDSNKTDTPDYVLIYLRSNYALEANYANVIGGYIIRDNNTYMPNPMFYYIFRPSSENLLTIKDACESEVEGVEKAIGYCNYELIGDVNYDNTLNIRDVTVIQKSLSKLLVIENDDIYGMVDPTSKIIAISDFNQDGNRNIRDATAIQKYLAKLDY